MELKSLDELLEGIECFRDPEVFTAEVTSLAIDSRKVVKGTMFIALKGTKLDGHTFIEEAIASGASVIVCSELPSQRPGGVVFIRVPDSHRALARIAANFWGDPSKKLKLVGVTGTNGKTTIATLLYELAGKLGFRTGLLSTIENKVAGRTIAATHTTPDLLSLNEMLAGMVEAGCDLVAMEVSSHAIDQGRVAGLDFDGAIFTNLTVDHLDYHKSFKNYVYTKKKFFDLLKPEAFALVNTDDKNGLVMLQNTRAMKKSYALKRMADFKGVILRNSLEGLHMKMDDREAHFRLIGKFNAYNLLAVYGAAQLLGFEAGEVLVALSGLEPARGRFEIVYNKAAQVTAIIDYAHTADALENVLNTIAECKSREAKVITIAGAGGDRDTSKRAPMGRVSAQLSDTVIFTTDNARSEDPQQIVNAMIAGVETKDQHKVLTVLDRAEAIRVATKIASEGDVILIAGKGHETYQDIKGVRYPFDDKQVLKNIWF